MLCISRRTPHFLVGAGRGGRLSRSQTDLILSWTDADGEPMTEVRATRWQAFWREGRWWKAALAVIVYLAVYRLAGAGLGAAFGDLVDTDNIFANPASVFFGIGSPIVVGAALLLFFVASIGWFRPIFSGQPVSGRWWMWIAVVLVSVPIVLRFVGIDYAGYGAGVVATSLFVGLFIGFTEELLYRGIVVQILRDGGHREWTVAVLSSLFFALSHLLNLLSGQPLVVTPRHVVNGAA